MIRNFGKYAPLLGIFMLGACAQLEQQLAPQPNQFDLAVAEAAHSGKATPALKKIRISNVEVVAWGKPEWFPGESPNTVTLTQPTWVTILPDLLDDCNKYGPEGLQSRVEQRLGMRQGEGNGRFFVTMLVRTSELLRPCGNPQWDTPSCSATVDEAYAKRQPESGALVRRILTSEKPPEGFPIVRGGYTFDYSPDNKDSIGIASYIMPAGMKGRVLEKLTLAQYCRRGK